MSDGVVVIEIGCLECNNASNLLGWYPTREAARAAHPDAKLRADMDDGDPFSADWWGSSVAVIFDVAGVPVVGGEDNGDGEP